MFDYKNWIKQAVSFIDELKRLERFFELAEAEISAAPPLTEREFAEIVEQTDKFIPAELKRFWTEGAADCDFRFYMSTSEPEFAARIEDIFGSNKSFYGGANFIAARELTDGLEEIKEWGEETWIAEYPKEPHFWLNSVPFIRIENGDYLSLDITDRKDNPPVIYLSHDDESFIIAESFTDFLTHWANLCYIGPERWDLEDFLNEKRCLTSDSDKAEKLRELLRAANP